jgi:hypothetical protein
LVEVVQELVLVRLAAVLGEQAQVLVRIQEWVLA